MSTLTVTKNYDDGAALTEAHLDAMKSSLETWANGNIDSTNITTGGIEAANLASNSVETAKIGALQVTLAKLAAEVSAFLVPVGSVMAYAGTTAPTGYLVCDGTAVSRSTYSALFTAIGEAHGEGDNSTTFNLPDYRGRFLRGTDNMFATGAAARDPDAAGRTAMNTGGNSGNNVGSVQADATALPNTPITSSSDGSHNHSFTIDGGGGGASGSTSIGGAAGISNGNGSPLSTVLVTSGGAHTHTTSTGGDNETRPTNAYVNYIIKF